MMDLFIALPFPGVNRGLRINSDATILDGVPSTFGAGSIIQSSCTDIILRSVLALHSHSINRKNAVFTKGKELEAA
jgi:hypothetical protein